MSIKSTIAIAATFGANAVLGHGLVSGYKADGVFSQGFILDYYYQKQSTGSFPKVAGWYAENLDNGFIEPNSYTSSDINCHKNSAPGATSITVAAGGKLDFEWNTWPASHNGPIITYAASCAGGDCTTVDKTSLKWFKIDQAGIDIATQKWQTEAMIANNNTYSMTVPSALKEGAYVFRHEIIALHSAQQTNGAQNYPQCVNVKVTGSGTAQPEGVAGTALYTPDEAGIKVNIYTKLTSYSMPGPAMPAAFASSGSSGGSAPATSTTAAPATSATATATATSTATATAAPTATAGTGTSTELPESFTLESFITWLRATASKKTRRSHPREMMI